MSKLITSKFRTHTAAQFLESFSETSNTIYYLGAHKSMPYDTDTTPPDIVNTVRENYYSTYDDLIFGKHISPDDIKHMIKNIPWTSGIIYDMYDDTLEDLENKNFYVYTKEGNTYSIFKCLDNNNNSKSTSQPLLSETSANDDLYITNDGYQWKYMYSISISQYNKFATTDYIPVVPNSNVSANAVSGAINTIIIEYPGSQYNSYASGTIKESIVGGNTLLYTLSSDKFAEYDVTVANAAIFTEGKVTSTYNNKTSNGVIVAVFTANNTLRISNATRAFSIGANLMSVTNSSITSAISNSTPLTVALSSNSGFYNDMSFYIRSGTGAGQLRKILAYNAINGVKQVILNTALNIIPDSTSIFEIGPRVVIKGDGVDANAVVIVNPSSNSIAEIEIIDSGSNYTYADVTIIANTGNIATGTNTFVNTSNARVRAIIPPKGGHGYDVINELYATRIGIGVSFAGSESSTIPATNDFRKISVIKDPLFANAELTLSTSVASNFTAGEYIVQESTGASGQITNRSGANLRLTNIVGFFKTNSSPTINVDTIDIGTSYVIVDSGDTDFTIIGSNSNSNGTIFTANAVGTGTGTVKENINMITGNTSGYKATVSSLDRSFDTFDQRQIFNVQVTSTGPANTGFQLDELVLQSGLQLVDSDIVKLTINQSAYVYNDGELITQYNGANTTANGIIIARYNNILEVNPNYGSFVSGNNTVNYIVGSETSANSIVSNADNSIQANGLGYIHSLNGTGNTVTQIGLSGVKGVFNISDGPTNTINTFVGQTNKAVANLTSRAYEVDSVKLNSLVDGSGEFMYIENFSPVTRSTSQTEKVKLIIEF